MAPVADVPARARRAPALLLVATVAVGAGVVLRFVTSSALWLDEAQSVAIARLPIDQIPQALRHDGAPPLYYLLLHGWMKLFGTGDVAVRALSGACSVATIAVVALVVDRVGGRRAAAVAVVLLAANPFAIRYGTEARMYGLVGLEVALALLALIAAVRSPTERAGLVGLAVTTAALLWTHYWAMYLLAAGAVVLVGWLAWPQERRHRRVLRRILLAMLVGLVLWMPWASTFLYQSGHTGTPWASPAPPATLIIAFFDLNGGLSGGAISLTLVVLAGAVIALLGRRLTGGGLELRPPEIDAALGLALLVIGTLAAGLAAGLLFGVAYAGRYATVALVPFVMLVALGAARLDRLAGRAFVAVAVAIGLVTALSTVGAARTQAPRFEAVLTDAPPGDVVVYCPDQLGPATHRLLGDRLAELGYPRGDTPAMVDWVDYADAWRSATPRVFAAQASALAGAHDVWLVVNDGYHGTEADCRGLLQALQSRRPDGRIIVAANGHYFENAALWRLPPG